MDPLDSVQGSPEAGASAPPQVSSATPSDAGDSDSRSVDEILGLGSFDKEPAADTPKTEPTEAKAPEAKVEDAAAKPDDAPPVTQREPLDESKPLQAIASDELKRVLEKAPEVRDFYFRERAYSELFPTVQEARELRSMFPTREDAAAVMGQAETLLNIERTYVERPGDFIAEMAKQNAEAFDKFLKALPETVYNHSQDLFRARIAEPVVGSLIANLADKAVMTGDEELKQAVAVLQRHVNVGSQEPMASEDPRVAELERFKRETEERERATNEARTVEFSQSIQRTFMDGLEKRIGDTIARLKPDMANEALERVKGEILDSVVQKLTQNRWLSQEAGRRTRAGDKSPNHLNEVVGLLAKHADPLIAPTVAAVMDEWTRVIVRANAQERSEAKQSAAQREVGNGQQTTPRDEQGRFKVREPKTFYKKYSDEDIIEGRHRQAEN